MRRIKTRRILSRHGLYAQFITPSLRRRQTRYVLRYKPVDLNEILDELSHEFLLVKIKRELDTVHDLEELRRVVLTLVDLVETQKAMFKKLLWELVDDDPEGRKLFE